MEVIVSISSLTPYVLAEQSTLYQIIMNDIVHSTMSVIHSIHFWLIQSSFECQEQIVGFVH